MDWFDFASSGQLHRRLAALMFCRNLTLRTSKSECVTAMNVSVKDQLGLSVSVAVGSAIVCYPTITKFDT